MFDTIMIVKKSSLLEFIPDVVDVLAEKDVALVVKEDKDFELFVKPNQEEKSPIEIELDDKDFMMLAQWAHEKDITLNKLIEHILLEEIEKAGL